MAKDNSLPPTPFEHLLNETDDLTFLRDEGLDLLASFRRVRDRSKRDLIRALVAAFAEDHHST